VDITKLLVSPHSDKRLLQSSLIILTNLLTAFVGSGLGGMGVLNFTLDWSNITSSIMLSPWWTQVIQFVAFVLSVWVLVPIAKYKGLCKQIFLFAFTYEKIY
jgi:OPT oligopeptide transporter protein